MASVGGLGFVGLVFELIWPVESCTLVMNHDCRVDDDEMQISM